MESIYPVYTLKNECHDCYKCVRECPVKAIKVKDGSASVLAKKCIACGHCVQVCPSNAKRVRNDIEKVKALLSAKKDIYVSLAPSWSGVYDYSPQKMVAILKKIGFYAVSETALGAQEVSIKTAEILKNGKQGLYISSACPVIVDFIRKYHPDFSKNIVPIASPAITHAKLLKEKFGKDISIVFIGPCIGKKNESDKHQDLINASLTFEELNYWISELFIDINGIDINANDNFVLESAYEGALYPLDGGMNETIRKSGIDNNTTLINISSLDNFNKALNSFSKEKCQNKIFIEALACSGGCINGPCLDSKKSGISIMYDVLNKIKYRDKIPDSAFVTVPIEYNEDKIEKKQYTYDEIINAMQSIGKYSQEDELNCGGCGYTTCQDLAKALISGDAEPSMCVSYMRKIAMKKASAMLRVMPSAVVIVDKNLSIIESNEAFIKMFCSDMYEIFSSEQDGLSGASIDRIVPFYNLFTTVMQTGNDIHKEHYLVKNRLYDINIFKIEEGEITGAVITDVTKSETNREQIAKRAREVINKNIAIVQNIACLLGEHMVETEQLLSSIAEDYETDSEEDE